METRPSAFSTSYFLKIGSEIALHLDQNRATGNVKSYLCVGWKSLVFITFSTIWVQILVMNIKIPTLLETTWMHRRTFVNWITDMTIFWAEREKKHEFIRNVLCFFLPGFELLSCECESVLNYLVFLAHLLANSLNSRPNWKFWRWVLHPERPPVSTATHLFPKLWPRPTWSLLHPSTKRLAPEAWTQGNNSRKGWIQNTTQPFFLRLLLLHPSTSSSVWVCWAASCGS